MTKNNGKNIWRNWFQKKISLRFQKFEKISLRKWKKSLVETIFFSKYCLFLMLRPSSMYQPSNLISSSRIRSLWHLIQRKWKHSIHKMSKWIFIIPGVSRCFLISNFSYFLRIYKGNWLIFVQNLCCYATTFLKKLLSRQCYPEWLCTLGASLASGLNYL